MKTPSSSETEGVRAPGDGSLELVLWTAGLSSRSWREQCEIAALAGMSAISISPPALRSIKDAGKKQEMLDTLARLGLALSHLDGVSSWAPERHPSPSDSGYALVYELFDFSAQEILDLAEEFGFESMAAVGAFSKGAVSFEETCRSFSDFCDRARAHDIRVDLEFIPHWGIPDLTSAWDIISAVRRENCGILVDTWHLCRSTYDLESDLALLDAIPAQYLSCVQLCDGKIQPQAASTFEELVNIGRGFPGEGELDIRSILSRLLRKGGLKSVGPEPFSAALAAMSPAEIAERAATSTRDALLAAYSLL